MIDILGVEERVAEVIPLALKVMCEFIVNGLHSTHKIPFLLLFLIRAVYASEPEEEIAEIMLTLSEFIQNFDQADLKETEERARFSSRLATFLVALKQKDSESLPIFPAILSFIDVELRKKDINIDLTKLLKRIYIEFDVRKPMLIVESGALDTWWLLAKLTLKHIRKKPQLLVMGKHLDDDEINMNLNNCKLSGRWIILQGLHNQIDNLYRIKFPETDNKFMIFATLPRHVVLPEFVISQVCYSRLPEFVQNCFL